MDGGAWQAVVCGVQRVKHNWAINTFNFYLSEGLTPKCLLGAAACAHGTAACSPKFILSISLSEQRGKEAQEFPGKK